MLKMFASIWLVFVIIKLIASENPVPEVTIKNGKLIGHTLKSENGREFSAFEGIPYAQPPIRNLRFELPQPAKPWKGTWIATTLYRCLQYDHFTDPGADPVKGDEDCLYVNVYTPNIKANLDVIVFIHGGAFMFNHAGCYGPAIIMDRDVVYVTFNYRLGPLGFLSTEDNVLPGNYGLRDQLLALKWIKENIKYFGGNPDSVTITGMSAGGASVQLHTISPLSRELFHKAFAQSGVALNSWVLVENSLKKSKKLGKLVGCPSKNNTKLVTCLKTRSGRQIAESVKHFQKWLYNPFSPFGVVIDKWAEEPFMPDHPLLLLKQKKVTDVPIIFSFVSCEGLYPAADFISKPQYLEDIESRWNELMPHILDYDSTVKPKNKDKVSQKIRKTYLAEKAVTPNTFLDFVQIITDRMFTKDIMDAAKLHSAAIKSPVFNYMFSYAAAHSKSEPRAKTGQVFCAAHGDDTVYVLKTPINMRTNEKDKKMSEMFLNMWTSFAKTGKPEFVGFEWPEVPKTPSTPIKYIHISSPDNIEIKSGENFGNKKFWDSLPIHENEKLFKQKDEL